MSALLRRAIFSAAALILCAAAVAPFLADAQTPSTDQSDLRVAVRPLEDGRLEFGVISGGQRLLPQLRYLTPALISSRIDQWLRSSALTISTPDPDDPDQTIEREVRVAVRPLADGRTEFALLVDGERILPRLRYLSPGLAQNRQGSWLRSSAVEPPAPAEPEPAEPDEPAEPAEDEEVPDEPGEPGEQDDEPDQPPPAPLAFAAPSSEFEFTAGSQVEAVALPAATGGEGEIRYALSAAIPGLAFDAASRTLSGTPSSAGAYSGAYTATDAAGNRAAAAVSVTVHAAATAPRFRSTAGDIELEAGQALSPVALPEADGDDLAYSLAPIPPGLAFDPATRQLSGTATEAGEYAPVYVVRNARGGSDRQTLAITVRAANSVPTFSGSVAASEYEVGDEISLALPAAAGGNGALDYSISGSVPGLVFNKASRILSGTADSAGSYTLTLTVRDSDARILGDTDSITFTIRVTSPAPVFIGGGGGAPPPLDQRPIFNARIDDQELERGDQASIALPFARGGDGALAYSLSPAIPGMTFDARTRRLSGAPANEGAVNVVYTARDADGDAVSLRFTITVVVTDSPPQFSPDPPNITVVAGVSVGTLELPAATDGDGALIYSLSGLPTGSGLSFDPATHSLSGTPVSSSAATWTVTYSVIDSDDNNDPSDGDSATFDINVELNAAPAFAAGASVANQSYGYGLQISALSLPAVSTAGNGATRYSVSSLPTGLSFDETTRRITGAPTASGAASITYTAQDSDNDSAAGDADTLSFTITVGANAVPAFAESSISNLNLVVGQSLSAITLPAVSSAGNGSTTYEISALPAGLSFNQSTRRLSGAPQASAVSGSPYTITYTARDADVDTQTSDADAIIFVINVQAESKPAFSSSSISNLPSEDVGIAIPTRALPAATGGNYGITYSVSYTRQGSLSSTDGMPANLSFSPSTRRISGTPNADGTFTITYKVVDGDSRTGAADEDSISFTITIAANTAPAFSSTTLSGTTQGLIQNSPMQALVLPAASGGNGAIVYADLSTALPTGLSWSASTRTISGTPTATGNTTITWTARDSDSDATNSDRASFSFTLQVAADSSPSFGGSVSNRNAIEGQAITAIDMPSVTGGNGDLRYSATGLPGGLSINSSSGQITGSPNSGTAAAVANGQYSVTVTVVDADGNTATSGANRDIDTVSFTITVAADTKHSFAATPTVGNQSYIATLAISALQLPAASGGNGNPVYTATGLPGGLLFSSTTRRITGTPSVPAQPATLPITSTVTYKVADSDSNDANSDASTLTFSITIVANTAPAFSSTTLSGTTQGLIQNSPMQALVLPAASGGNGAIVYADLSSALPTGLSWSASTRTISGTPTATGNTTVTWTARDSDSDTSNGDRASFSFTLQVAADSTPSFGASVSNQNAIEGQAITSISMPSVTGGNGDLRYSATGLPGGLSISSSTGQITGSPNSGTATAVTNGEYSVTVTVVDADGNTATSGANKDVDTVSFTITVAADTKHAFASTPAVGNRTYIATQAITALQLPAASGGNGNPVYTATGLPGGLLFSSTTRRITGTPTAPTPPATLPAVSTVTYKVDDSDSNNAGTDASTLTFNITIVADTAPVFSASMSNQTEIATQAVDLTLPSASGGNGATVYSVQHRLSTSSGAYTAGLPSGLSFSASTRKITGSHATAATYTIRYIAADSDADNTSADQAEQTFNIQFASDTTPTFSNTEPTTTQTAINGLLLVAGQTITTITLPAVTAKGNGAGDTVYSIDTSATATSQLPSGLVFNAGTRVISGTLGSATAATYTITYRAHDADADTTAADSATLTYSLVVAAESAPAFASGAQTTVRGTISTNHASGNLGSAKYIKGQNIPELQLPAATGGNGSLTYSIDESLPAGISFSASTRKLTGSTSAAATGTLTYRVEDADANSASNDEDTLTFTINFVNDSRPSFSASSIGNINAIANSAITNVTLPAPRNGNLGTTISLNDSDVAGISFSTATRVLSGTPTAAGTYNMTYKVVDGDANSAAGDETELTFDIIVAADSAPDFASSAAAGPFSYDVGIAIGSVQLPTVATAGNGATAYSLSPAVSGLTLNTATGVLSGTPTTSQSATDHTYRAQDADGNSATTGALKDSDEITIRISVAADSAPDFGSQTISDKDNFVEGKQITAISPTAATGGNGTLAYSASGLPAGLVISASTGSITGTPSSTSGSASGTDYSVTITVHDADINRAGTDADTLSFTITVYDNLRPAIAANTIAGSTIDQIATQAFSLTLPAASSGNGDLSLSISGAPASLSFDTATRVLSGMPTEAERTAAGANPYAITYTVKDSDNDDRTSDQASLSFSLNLVEDTVPAFASTTLSGTTRNYIRNSQITNLVLPAASGGNGAIVYADLSTALPNGLTWTASTRTISGTPTAAGDTTITWTARDSDADTSNADRAAFSFTISVADDSHPTFSAAVSAQSAIEGQSFTLDMPSVSGGNGTLSYSASGLPAGLSISTSTGQITGDPDAGASTAVTGGAYSVTVTVTDNDGNTAASGANKDIDTRTFTITVAADTKHVFASTPAVGNQTYVATLAIAALQLPSASGGNGNPVYSVSGLPDGLAFSSTTRRIIGSPSTPTAPPETSTVTYKVDDSDSNNAAGDASTLSFDITVVANTAPAFSSTTLSGTTRNLTQNSPMTNLVLPAASGGNGAIVYADLSTALPAGLSWSASTRTISGTPTGTGNTTITWTARDSDSDTRNSDRASFSFTISVAADSVPSFSGSVSDQDAIEGQTITAIDMPSASGGNGTLSYGASGLPSGLSISSTSGQITGAPDAGTAAAVSGGEYSVTVTVSDADGNTATSGSKKDVDTVSFTITVAADTKHAFASSVSNQTYIATQQIDELQLPSASGGNGDPDYAVSALPDGLTFTESSLKITGTPNVPTPPATLPATTTITYSVIDADDNTANADKSELTFDITIVADTVPAFPSGTSISNKAYIQNTQINDLQLPAASGGNGAIQYSVSNLPVGLVASNDKPPKITGTPTTAETKSVTYTAKDSDKDNAAGDQVSLTFTIEVAADTAPDFGSGSVSDQNTVEGQAITAIDMPSTTGGNGDLAYSAGSTLPAGLVINSSSGQITGTPNAGANASSPYTVTITVSDADDTTGSSDEDSLSFTINVQAESAPSFGAGATRKTIANLSLDNGVQMTSETLPEAAGGNYGRTYSLCLSSDTPPACTLPGGLAFNAPTRVLSGTPNANGSYAMTYKAADGDGKTGSGDEDSLTFTITVAGNVKPTLASNTVSGATYNWVTGTAASLQLPAGSGGNGALSYELNDSALPNGLVWSSSARTISGTPSATTVQAGAAMTYAVTDADSDNAASDKTSINFTIKVQTNSAPAYGANAVSTFTSALSTLHTQGRFVAGLAIPTITVPAASGGNYGLTYSVDGLPAALSFNAGTRQLTGTAHSSVGDSPTFTARVRDNDNNATAGDVLSTTFKFTTVANVKPTFPTAQSDISDLIQNSPADITLPAGSGGNIGRTYILNEADLPGGLSWSASTRKITGTPTAATDANGAAMTYKVRDDDSDTASSDESSMTFKIIVAADAVPAFAAGASISNRTFDVGIDIGTINLPAVSTAGNGTTVYSLSPAVPGLTLNTATGALTGAPTGAQAETTHTYRAGDADGNTATSGATKDVAELTFTITVRGDSRPMFASADPVADQEWAVGHRVAAFTLPEASGGNGTLSYDINDEDLPGGLAWNAGTRTISGTPLSTTVSAVTITYTVADSDSNTETDSTESGYDADSATFTIKITADSSPALAADAAPNRTWVTGSAASAVLPPATGGNRPLTYAVTGTLPRGVVWTASTRTLGGTPTESGTFNLAYRATDPDGDHAERTFTLTIDASDTAPAFAGGASISAQSWTQGKAIAPLTLPAASGGNGTLTYRLDPAIPGLVINQSTRQLSGAPRSSMASTSITLRAADADQVTGSGDEASLSFNVTIGARDAVPGFPSGTTISSHYASIGTAITNIVLPAATGGNGALSYAVSGLPGGLVWTAGTRTISGTPSGAGGVFTVTYTASDADSNRAASDQAARRFTITVSGPPVFGANGGRTTDQRANPSARTWTAISGSTQTRYFAWPRAGSGNSLGSDYDHDAAITGFPGAGSCTASAAASTTAATNGEQFTWRAYSCRPSGSGTFTGSFTAHDRDGDRASSDAASYSFQITINGPPRFLDRSSVSRSVIANQQFSIALPAAGGDWQGNGALTYSLETDGGGALPTGISFNSGTRTVIGALPAGSYSLEYEVEDADGEKDSLKVLINAGSTAGSVFVRFPSAIRHRTLRNGFAAGTAMSWQLPAASGGTGTLTYRVRWRGGAPAGIAFNAATRTLSGTATGSYTKQGWLDAIDPSTTQQDILTFEFTVGPDTTPAFPQGTSVGGLWLIRNRAMTPVTLPAATGGNGILSYSFSPAVPGLVLDPATRMLSGTPANFGSTNVTLSARDTDSDAATNAPTFRIIVSADTAPSFGSTSVSQANRTFTVGSAKTLTLPAATGGNGTLAYELAGRLPSGLAFTAASRRISGTADANQQGYYILELRAADADNNEASSDEGTLRFTLIVDLPAPTAPPSPGNLSFVVGQTVNRQLAAAAYAHGTLTYELRNLPAAFAFDPATRRLTTATALAAGDIGTATVEYAAINALGGTAAVSFQIAVAADSMPAFSQASLSNQTYTSGTQIQALVLPGATANTGNAPLTYTLAPIPSGLAWNGATRTLSGTPDAVGSTSAVYQGDRCRRRCGDAALHDHGRPGRGRRAAQLQRDGLEPELHPPHRDRGPDPAGRERRQRRDHAQPRSVRRQRPARGPRLRRHQPHPLGQAHRGRHVPDGLHGGRRGRQRAFLRRGRAALHDHGRRQRGARLRQRLPDRQRRGRHRDLRDHPALRHGRRRRADLRTRARPAAGLADLQLDGGHDHGHPDRVGRRGHDDHLDREGRRYARDRGRRRGPHDHDQHDLPQPAVALGRRPGGGRRPRLQPDAALGGIRARDDRLLDQRAADRRELQRGHPRPLGHDRGGRLRRRAVDDHLHGDRAGRTRGAVDRQLRHHLRGRRGRRLRQRGHDREPPLHDQLRDQRDAGAGDPGRRQPALRLLAAQRARRDQRRLRDRRADGDADDADRGGGRDRDLPRDRLRRRPGGTDLHDHRGGQLRADVRAGRGDPRPPLRAGRRDQRGQ